MLGSTRCPQALLSIQCLRHVHSVDDSPSPTSQLTPCTPVCKLPAADDSFTVIFISDMETGYREHTVPQAQAKLDAIIALKKGSNTGGSVFVTILNAGREC